MKNAVSWERVSSYLQTSEHQTAPNDAYADSHALRIVERISIVASGSKAGKLDKHHARVTELIRSGAVRAVIVLRLDRLTRKGAGDALRILSEWTDAGAEVHLVEMNTIFTDNAHTRLIFSVLAEVAAMEAEIKRGRQQDMLTTIEANGGGHGSLPMGLEWTGEKLRKVATINEAEAARVRGLITDVSNGTPVVAASGKYGVTQFGGLAILRQEAYSTGKWSPREGYVVDVPVIIDRKVHLLAREKAAERGFVRTKYADTAESYTGCITCGCGRKMYGSHAKDSETGKIRTYYKCMAGHTANMDKATKVIDDALTAKGEVRWVRRFLEAGTRYAELEALQESIASWNPATGDVKELLKWRAQAEELKAMPDAAPEGVARVRSNQTWDEWWPTASIEDRRDALASELKVVLPREVYGAKGMKRWDGTAQVFFVPVPLVVS